jgi:hypothetical protein
MKRVFMGIIFPAIRQIKNLQPAPFALQSWTSADPPAVDQPAVQLRSVPGVRNEIKPEVPQVPAQPGTQTQCRSLVMMIAKPMRNSTSMPFNYAL